MSAGDATTFTAELTGGEHAGEQAEVAVTVHSVKVKELPELDDEFAQSASEYDTLGEFRAGTRTRLESVKRLQQAAQARDRALEVLLDRLGIPLAGRAAVTDEAGNPVDVKAITAEARGEAEAQADAEAGDGAEAVTEAGSGDAGAEGPDGGAEGEAEAVDSGAGDAEDKPARAGTAKTGKAKTGKAKAGAAKTGAAKAAK